MSQKRTQPLQNSDRSADTGKKLTPLQLIAAAALAALIVLMGVNKITGDDDVFWHLATGRWIVEHGSIPSTDVFGYPRPTQGWIPFEWGWDVFVYAVHQAGGLTAVQCIPVAVWLGVFTMLFVLMHRSRIPFSITLMTLAVVLMATIDRLTPRPHVITVLGLASVLFIYLSFREWPGKGISRLYTIPPLFLVWGNMHPGVINGVILLVLLALAEVLTTRLVRTKANMKETQFPPLPAGTFKKVLVIFALSAGVLLLNPHGIYTYIYSFEHINLQFLHVIKEWDPPFSDKTFSTGVLTAYKILLFTGILTLIFALRRRNALVGIPFTGFALLSLRAVRFIADFAVVGALGIARGLHEVLQNLGAGVRRVVQGPLITIMILVLMIAVMIGIPHDEFYMEYLHYYRWFGFGVDTAMYSMPMMEFLKSNDIRGTPFHDLEVGGLLIWERPGEKNFIDSRNLNDTIAREYVSILRKYPGFEQKLVTYGVDYLVLHPIDLILNSQSMQQTLISYASTHRSQWKLVYWDDLGMLYLKDVPKFRPMIDRYEYKILHPYLFYFRPDEFRALRLADPLRYATELERKQTEEPRGLMVNQIALGSQ